MDPDTALEQAREYVAEINALWDACPEEGEFTEEQQRELADKAIELAQRFEALDGWLTNGGFPPKPWGG